MKKVSGREQRNATHTNHCISKQIVLEALSQNSTNIIMENLTNIHSNIKTGKQVRSRLQHIFKCKCGFQAHARLQRQSKSCLD